MMDVLVHLGIVMHLNGHFERAQALMEEGLACALAGELGEAKRVYVEALRLSREIESMPLMLEALAGVAELNLQTGSYEQASELSSFLRSHPSSTHETRDRADRIVRCTREYLTEGQIQEITRNMFGETLDQRVKALL